MKKPLTELQIKALTYNGKGKFTPYLIGGAERLYILVYPSGVKKFKILVGNTYKSLKDGSVEMTSPYYLANTARLKALEIIESKLTPKTAPKFIDVANDFFEIKKHKVAIKTYEKDIFRFRKYLLPTLSNKRIDEIDRQDIAHIIQNAEKLCDARRNNTIETPNRVKNLLNQIIEYAINKGHIEKNPTPKTITTLLKNKAENGHFATITEPSEIKELISKINESSRDVNIKNALFFSILTAQRSNNIRSLKWCDIDDSGEFPIWSMNANEMKMKRPHKIALSTLAYKIVKEQKNISFNEYVFSGNCLDGRLSDMAINRFLRDLGYYGRFTTHSVRSMFKTICANNRSLTGLGENTEEMCLAHAQKNQVIDAYQRDFLLNEQFRLFEWYSKYLNDICEIKIITFDDYKEKSL